MQLPGLTPYRRARLREGPAATWRAFVQSRRRARNQADELPDLAPAEARALDPALDATRAEIEASRAVVRGWAEAPGPVEIGSVQWFLPWFHNPLGGGPATILRLAGHFAQRGAEQRFHVYDRDEAPPVELPGAVTVRGDALAPADVAIATTWSSVFDVVRFAQTRAKFFLVQDYEPAFHPAGSTSALFGEAGRLGLPGIVNTPGLARVYGHQSVVFTPAVDHEVFHPPAQARPAEPVRIVFYGRPKVARNAFVLGLRALRQVKERWGDGVEIVSAGADWHPGAFGAADVLTNAGALRSVAEVADLYRSAHIGVVLMLTAHPSYQPLEYMACGVATVSNDNPHTRWLLRHEHNALTAPPLPSLLAAQIDRLVADRGLRARLAAVGLRTVEPLAWEPELERVWRWMTKA